MYTNHFSLRNKPFSILPNSKVLFMSRCHEDALTILEYGLTERSGFILLTGEAGTGKTTLMQYALDTMASRMEFAVLVNACFSPDQILRLIMKAFGIPLDNRLKRPRLEQFHQFLIDRYAHNRQVLLVIDEAQDLSNEALRTIRMLADMQCDDRLLVQVLLVGQANLRERLRLPRLNPLAQCIAANCHLDPLDAHQTQEYIAFLVEAANGPKALFTQDAIRLIYQHAGGIPRIINKLCDAALVYGYGKNLKQVDSGIIECVLSDDVCFTTSNSCAEESADMSMAALSTPVL